MTATTIDLSRVPLPDAIERFSFEAMQSGFLDRFQTAWDAARARDPSLPVFNASPLEAEPAVIVGEAFSYLRLLDRQRVNDALRSVFATTAKGSDLDAVVARQNVQRLVLVPATADAPAVMESDAALLNRYLLSFDRGSAGSAGAYLFQAWTAWPQMGDARVNGRAIHGRRGDTDIVVTGPGGRTPTTSELATVRAACLHPSVVPEAVSVAVIPAKRAEYVCRLVIEVPPGPDADLVRQDALARMKASADARTLIGGEIPAGLLAGAAYGPNTLRVRDLSPVVIEAEPYTVPVVTSATITVEVRS